MLHAISWMNFLTLMGLGTLIYYGWLVLKFLPLGFLRGLAGKREGTGLPFTEWRKEEKAPKSDSGSVGGEEATGDEGKADGNGAASGGETHLGETKQLALPLPAEQLEEPVPKKEEKSLGELAAELDVELWLIYQRAEKGMKKEELLYAITLLLDKEVYRPLKGSHMQPPLSEGIFGGLLKHGSVRLDEMEMNGLWNR